MNNSLTTTTAVSVQEMRSNSEKYPRLHTIPPIKAVEQLVNIVATAFMYSGRNADVENVKFIASHLYEELMLDEQGIGTKYISMAEISRAVKRSILGQGKEMFGISVASLYAVVADYCKGEGHVVDQMVREETRRSTARLMGQLTSSELISLQAENFTKTHKANGKV